MPGEQIYYRASDACRILGIGQSTFYAWAHSGRLQTICDDGHYRVEVSEMERILGELADSEDGVTVKEACRLLGVCHATMYNWAKRGKIKITKGINCARITQEELDRVIRLRAPADMAIPSGGEHAHV